MKSCSQRSGFSYDVKHCFPAGKTFFYANQRLNASDFAVFICALCHTRCTWQDCRHAQHVHSPGNSGRYFPEYSMNDAADFLFIHPYPKGRGTTMISSWSFFHFEINFLRLFCQFDRGICRFASSPVRSDGQPHFRICAGSAIQNQRAG